MSAPKKIALVCGARPNFMKIAPVMEQLELTEGLEPLLVHTGQHYDAQMSQLFFDELGIPKPDIDLEVGSGSHAVQTAEIMKRFEPVCLEHEPDMVVVVGDVNSTIACALVAAKLHIPVAHIEAGLRSGDRSMPEEINRILTDSISDLLFVSEPSGVENLRAEGIPEHKIHFVGNVMIDTLLKHREAAERSTILTDLDITQSSYVVVTLHRPNNVDDPETLEQIVDALVTISEDATVVFPVHPRTRQRLEEYDLLRRLEESVSTRLVGPLGYLDFLKLMSNAKAVLTDSGGIQEETTILGVPCLTLRENTERPITVEQGANQLVSTTFGGISSAFKELPHNAADLKPPDLWDGQAAKRIVAILAQDRSIRTAGRGPHFLTAR